PNDDGGPAVPPAAGADRHDRAGWRFAGEVLSQTPARDASGGGREQSTGAGVAPHLPRAAGRCAVAGAAGRWRAIRARTARLPRYPAGRRLRRDRYSGRALEPALL